MEKLQQTSKGLCDCKDDDHVTWCMCIQGVCVRYQRLLIIRAKRQTAHLVPLVLFMLERDSTGSVHTKLSLNIVVRLTMRNIVLIILLAALVNAQRKYKFCAPVETINENACLAVQRGDSEVSCLRVADSAECSIRLAQGEADFGVFNAEELLLAHPFYESDIIPIHQLKHRDRQTEEFEFQTVALVHTDLTQKLDPPDRPFEHLKNGGLCHPGFSKSQWWNDYILKYFEKMLSPRQCRDDVSVAENEVRNLRDFFGKACRPGEWVSERSIDQELKRKYRELCALCDDQDACTYRNKEKHGHRGALECLANRRGNVAYIALSYVREYLGVNTTFEFLCPDGVRMPLTTPNPCAWIKQPWSVIAARTDLADTLKIKLSDWLRAEPHKESWKLALSKIIQEDSIAINITGRISLTSYLSKGRDIDLRNTQICERTIRWCTVGDMETNKCKWVARVALGLGIEPQISCVKSKSVFECLRKITEDQADIITIDSNYGYVARKVYGLSTVLYCDTEADKNSRVIAVVRQQSDNNYPIKSFQDIKGRTACFPEYAGISWLSFVNIARKIGIISPKSCDYPLLVSKLVSGACTPGIKDRDRSRSAATADVSTKLCSACTSSNNTSCAANNTNHYYHDKGAMHCLGEGAGDVAFVELGNILNDTIDQNNYRVLCKNGSLAPNAGFKIDDTCPLSVTIDSEVVGRKNNSQTHNTDVLLAFLKMEEWLGYRVDSNRPIHIYGPFNATYDLLFKDTTTGLVSTSSTQKTVEVYKDLFSHVYQCSTGHLTAAANYIFVALVALYHILPSHT